MTEVPPKRLPPLLRGSGVIAASMAVMNLGTYAFTVIAARILGPEEYGALAAVMGLLLVVNVVSLGLQATGARRVSAAPGSRGRTEADVLTATYKSALAVGLLCLTATPLVSALLRLDHWLTAAMIAVTAVPLTVMGGQAGILQGERRWLALASIYLAMGLGRVVFGTAALLIDPDTLGALTGVAVGAAVPVLVGSAALRGPRRSPGRPGGSPSPVAAEAPQDRGRSRRVLRELAHNSHAMLAFFALSNSDVVIARVMLDDHQSGLYAGGLILAKAVLFLPQFVVVIAFPAMSATDARFAMTAKALGLVLVIGLGATGVAWLLTDLAVTFVGGAAYAALGSVIWAFAAMGTLLAMIQLLVYDAVARQTKVAVLVVWAGLVTLLALAPTVVSLRYLLAAVVLVEGAVLVGLLGHASRRAGTRRHPPGGS